jgi:flagellar biosynthesis protein
MTKMKNELKRQVALALGYKPEIQNAPKLLAKGKGLIAEKIIELAKNKGIPIKKDDDLIKVLYKLDIDEEIPPELYEAVAELLAFIYKLNQKQ